jgi:di/tricarboxylate transporter
VVAGAVAGGGLTIIANAPNPAGVSILKKHFKDEVSPGGILAGAVVPTAIVWLIFMVFR